MQASNTMQVQIISTSLPPHIFSIGLRVKDLSRVCISKVHNKHIPLLKVKTFILYKTTSFAMHMPHRWVLSSLCEELVTAIDSFHIFPAQKE